MIPSGFYPNPKVKLAKDWIWNKYSDTGGYAHVINTAAAYKEYLDGKTNWELFNSVNSNDTL